MCWGNEFDGVGDNALSFIVLDLRLNGRSFLLCAMENINTSKNPSLTQVLKLAITQNHI